MMSIVVVLVFAVHCVTKSRVSQHQKTLQAEQVPVLIPPATFQRGMWVRAVSIASPDSLSRIITIAKQLDITDIYVQAVVAGYAYYNSTILPRSQYLSQIAPPSYDPLDSLITVAQQESLRVHAWVNALLVWSLKTPPDSQNHCYYQHPEWFITDISGTSMHEYTHTEWLEAGLEGLYLDPANPAVHDHISSICREIAQNYPVSGIHLDFIRYPGTLWGLARNDTSYIFAGPDGFSARWLNLLRYPQLSFKGRWLAWHNWKQYINKSRNIYEIVRKTAVHVEQHHLYPDCILTAAVFANPGLALYRFGQNWLEWDMIDYPILMSYCEEVLPFLNIVTHTQTQNTRSIYGIGLLWEQIDTVAFIQSSLVEEVGGSGICYFDFTTLDTLVDITVLQGTNMTFHLTLPDSTPAADPVPINFNDRPSNHYFAHHSMNLDSIDNSFPQFLLSLSLDTTGDLARLGITSDQFQTLVTEDVKAFTMLDKLLFPLPDTLIQPPIYTVAYEFYPWNGKDTLTLLNKARRTTTYSFDKTVVPDAIDPIARAVCTMKKGQKKVFTTMAGVYAIQVDDITAGGTPVAREDVDAQVLPAYAAWTIMRRIEYILTSK